MDLHQQYLTKNNCYKAAYPIKPIGIMVHSTGANNPTLRRYVQPDDGILGTNTAGTHWNQPTPGGQSVCVHAFIGKTAAGNVATYQTLPWTWQGWHSGSGKNGSANRMGYIGFEICEDGLTDATYFARVYQEAVELCAYLCQLFDLDPLADGVIICHSEGHSRGIASNHADVMHWFPKHGKSMDTFRADVAAEIRNQNETEEDDMVRYQAIAEAPAYAQATLEKMVDKGYIGGTGTGKKDENGRPADLDLSNDMIRLLVMLDRAGAFPG